METHKIGNIITNFENPSIDDIKNDGWTPVFNNGKIVEWIEKENN